MINNIKNFTTEYTEFHGEERKLFEPKPLCNSVSSVVIILFGQFLNMEIQC